MTSYTLIDANGRPYPSPTPGRFGGHRRNKVYGLLDCRSARRAIDAGGYVTNRVFFADESTAVAAGYRPCAVCLPAAYEAWKSRRVGDQTTTKPAKGPPVIDQCRTAP
jgi:hypothetical protein